MPAASTPAHLCAYLVLCGERPLLGGMAFDLQGVNEVVLGRGGPLAASALGSGRARIDVPDGTMSGDHARLAPAADGTATIEDLGSRNGTTVNGTKITGAVPVESGAVIRIGRTTLELRG